MGPKYYRVMNLGKILIPLRMFLFHSPRRQKKNRKTRPVFFRANFSKIYIKKVRETFPKLFQVEKEIFRGGTILLRLGCSLMGFVGSKTVK
jgi:hypothetical protein